MSENDLSCLLLSIAPHTAKVQEAFAVDTRDLRAVVVKLTVVDVGLVLCVDLKCVC